MRITLVAAVADNGVIGYRNRLPWRLPADLRYFKAATMGKPVLMGRLTWDSIGRPLPGRTNIVLTRDPRWTAEGALRAADLDEALRLAAAEHSELDAELMVIGGAEIYRLAEPLATRALLTRVHARPQGDAWFAELDDREWEQVSSRKHPADPDNAFDCSFCEYRRRERAGEQ